MSKRINIVLPDETAAVLDRVTAKGARSRFIDRERALREQLRAGYRANAERDLAISAEWFLLERKLGASSRPPVGR